MRRRATPVSAVCTAVSATAVAAATTAAAAAAAAAAVATCRCGCSRGRGRHPLALGSLAPTEWIVIRNLAAKGVMYANLAGSRATTTTAAATTATAAAATAATTAAATAAATAATDRCVDRSEQILALRSEQVLTLCLRACEQHLSLDLLLTRREAAVLAASHLQGQRAVGSAAVEGGELAGSGTRSDGWAPSGPVSPAGRDAPPRAASGALRRRRRKAQAL